MRISLIALHYAEYACRLAVALARHHDVQLILNEANLVAEMETEWSGLLAVPRLAPVILPHRRSLGILIGNASRILREVSAFRPDVVHAQEVTKDYAMPALLWLPRRYPMVLTAHDPQPHSGAEARQFRVSRHRIYQRLVRNQCDRAIVHGGMLQRHLVADTPRLAGRVDAIPHGPLGPTSPPDVAPEAATLLFFGRIQAYKGLKHFVDATLLLRQRGYAVRGIIAGEGPDLAPHRATIEANDCFELHDGFVPRTEVHELFRRARLVVMPYTDATQSGVAAMALGFGRPAVATRVGSIPEMIEDGRTGLLVPPRDTIALADAVESLLANPARYAQLAESAASAGRGRLGWDAIAEQSVESYRSAIAGRCGAMRSVTP